MVTPFLLHWDAVHRIRQGHIGRAFVYILAAELGVLHPAGARLLPVLGGGAHPVPDDPERLFLYVPEVQRCEVAGSHVPVVRDVNLELRAEAPDYVRLVDVRPVSYTHLRAHETRHDLVCRLLLEKKKKKKKKRKKKK